MKRFLTITLLSVALCILSGCCCKKKETTKSTTLSEKERKKKQKCKSCIKHDDTERHAYFELDEADDILI